MPGLLNTDSWAKTRPRSVTFGKNLLPTVASVCDALEGEAGDGGIG